jgi:hypothetical protein
VHGKTNEEKCEGRKEVWVVVWEEGRKEGRRFEVWEGREEG